MNLIAQVNFSAASSQYTRPEQRSLTSDDSNKSPTRDYGATGDIGSYSKEELLKKLDMLECVLENQRKFLEDHDIKIQEIENVINKILADKELKDNQTEIGKSSQINFVFTCKGANYVAAANLSPSFPWC